MKTKIHLWIHTIGLLVIVCCVTATSFADSTPAGYYDEDASMASRPDRQSAAQKIANSPAYFLSGVKETLKKPIHWIEEIYLFDKVRHIYDELTERGIYLPSPGLGESRGYPDGVAFRNNVYTLRGAGGDDRWGLYGVQYKQPDLLKGGILAKEIGPSIWGRWSFQGYQDYGVKILFDEVLNTQNDFEVGFRYLSAPREDFFGIGPKSSLGSGFTFDLEEIAFNVALSRQLTSALRGQVGAGVSRIEISNSPDKSKRQIFQSRGIEGVQNYTDLFYSGIGLTYDTRDSTLNPSSGEFANLSWGVYGNTTGQDMAYMKYRADVAKYLSLQKRRVLAGRLFVEYNDNLGNNAIPFFDKAQVGGARTIRGYQFNRFFDDGAVVFNLEYRYRIWKFRSAEADLYPFWDGGWVFSEFSDLEFDEFKTGYGVGIKFRWVDKGELSVEAAHSEEGTEIYVKIHPTF